MAGEIFIAATKNSVADIFARATAKAREHIRPTVDMELVQRRGKIPPTAYACEQFQHSLQLLRTQPLHKEKTIKECYANLTRLTHHYMFLQNQYIQYKDWAEHLGECIHEKRLLGYQAPIYIFILTSKPERSGMDQPTYDVAYRVGYSEAMPVIHAQNQERFQQGVMGKPLTPEQLSSNGINVLMGSLWTCVERPKGEKLLPSEYEEIYIHAKVAIVDDSAFTIGSANLNLRSMAIDSELNILSQAKDVAYQLRCELFYQCTGDPGPSQFADMKKFYQQWVDRAKRNLANKKSGLPLDGQLVAFYVDRKPGGPLV